MRDKNGRFMKGNKEREGCSLSILSRLEMSQMKQGKTPWNKGKKYDHHNHNPKEHANKTTFKLGHTFSSKTKERTSISMKRRWEDKKYKENQIRAIMNGRPQRPTSLERQMIDIIKRNGFPYRYVGNGAFWIGHKNPDFVNVNGEKICLEVANTIHHEPDYPEKRVTHFKKWGWKCIVFMTNKLNEEDVTTALENHDR